MRVKIKTDRCVGCGLCEENAPEIFTMGPHYAYATEEKIPDNRKQDVLHTAYDCPAEAIEILMEGDDALRLERSNFQNPYNGQDQGSYFTERSD